MSELDDAMDGAVEQRVSEASAWIDRVIWSSGDCASVGAEDAAGVDL